MRQLRAAAIAAAMLAAGTVTAGIFTSNSISPLATWSCEFVNSATDCGFALQAAAANRATNAGPGVDVPTGAVLTTLPGDSNIAGSGTNERADLSLAPSSSYCNQGQEEWWADSVMFPPSYVMPPQSAGWNWGVVFDFHHTGSTGQPNFEIASVPTGLELNVAGGASVVNLPTDPGYYSVALGPVTPNVWYNFMYHIIWSSGSDGLFQVWLDGQQVMNYSGPNLYVGESCYLKLANYHTPLGVTETVVHSRIVQGTSQLAVELPVSPPPVTVTLAPLTATVQTGGSQALTATVANTTNTAVTWQVNGVVGGNSTVGMISTAGVYSAPSAVPSPAAVTVTAVSVADPTQSGAALITIAAAPAPVTVLVAPGTASVQAGGSQAFSATVANTTNTAVTWEVNGVVDGNSTVGTIASSGVYTAPSAVPSPATVTVTAVSVADPSKSSSAQVTVTAAPPPPPPVNVSVTPATASLQTGGSQAFAATVTNTTNTAVTWQVNGVVGGNSTGGTISSSGGYTAPSTVPSPATVTVTAVSVADPTKSGAAQVTLSAAPPPPPPVSVSVAPGTMSLQTGGSQAFTAAVTNTTNTAVTWQVNGVVGGNSTVGTISVSGGYTAPAAVPSPATVSVTAVSVAEPTQSGAAQVTLVAAPPPVGVSIAPGTASVQTGASQEFTATVTNTTNAMVTWQVNGMSGGDATVGVISTSGVYSAPSLVPSPATVTVTAVSAADLTRSGSAQVTITAPSNAGPPDPAPAQTSGGGGGGSADSLTLLVCALALARLHRRLRGGAPASPCAPSPPSPAGLLRRPPQSS